MNNSNFLPRESLQSLIDTLRGLGYRTIGPRVQDGAIQYLDIDKVSQLPYGTGDDQSPGRYRLQDSGEAPRHFAWANGPQALKPYLFSARETLWRSTRNADGRLTFATEPADDRPLAVIGVRACDLAACRLQDQHFLDGIRDPSYAARRAELFTVAVHCSRPADTCFCASTGDGPRADTGFDIALGELDDGFVVAAGSDAGKAVVEALPTLATTTSRPRGWTPRSTRPRHADAALPSRNLRATLFDGSTTRAGTTLRSAAWPAATARVCPTCFCHAEQDVPTLDGASSEHVREWDSCFSEGHAYLHGFQVRPEIRHRFRQWMTHKLGSWHDQYGRSGCVGCGRCITWCPVGIDITEEARAICGNVDGGDS